jgi:hypothetical protein
MHHDSNYHGKVQKLPNKEKLPTTLEYYRMNELFVLQCIWNFEILHDWCFFIKKTLNEWNRSVFCVMEISKYQKHNYLKSFSKDKNDYLHKLNLL